jgi:hypothetical protein
LLHFVDGRLQEALQISSQEIYTYRGTVFVSNPESMF